MGENWVEVSSKFIPAEELGQDVDGVFRHAKR